MLLLVCKYVKKLGNVIITSHTNAGEESPTNDYFWFCGRKL
jgi:hypothetical protein